jgi:hypothetical protein
MTPREKTRADWQKRLEEWKTSGKTVTQWCQEKGIYKAAFYHWKKKLSEQILNRNSFIELKEDRALPIELEYRGIRIRLTENFDSRTLLRCLEALKRLPC